MAKVSVFNIDGKQIGDIELNDNIFGVEVNSHVMHRAVVQNLANKRQGTQSAKTRAEVRGGGKKPWRQKGTGRARIGSIRAPHWTGGGIVFAPKPRDYSHKLNKKEKRLALKSALTDRVNEGKLIVVDSLSLEEIKTKKMAGVFKNLNVNKGLLVVMQENRNAALSARNIAGFKVASTSTINVYDILKYDNFIVTKDAIEKIEEVYA